MTSLEELRVELLPTARPVWPEAGAPPGATPAADAPPGATAVAGASPGATPAAGSAGLPIAWVRVMKARVPAFDALEAGDLAIVPAPALAVIAQGSETIASLTEALLAAPVAGVLLVEGEPVVEPQGADPLDELAAALRLARVPSLRLPRADTPALERSIIGFIVARGAELERQASVLETQLERLAIEGGGAHALVAAIAGFLGRAVALESVRGAPLAVHAPPDAPDAVAAVASYHARPRAAVALRVPLPGGAGPAGAIALLGEHPVNDLARVAVTRVAGLLALELARDEAVRRAGDDARRADALPGAGPPWIVLLARQRTPGADDDAPAAREARESLRRELRLLAPARRMALRGDADSLEIRAVIALTGAAARAARAPGLSSFAGEDIELPQRIAAMLGRTVAVSRPFLAAADRPAAEAEARSTLEAALGLAEPPTLARADRLALYRMLGGLHNLPDGEHLAATLLEPLLAGRPDVRRERLATLRALLDHGGVNEAAHALGVHRNTVAYRVRRIEEVTGWRLADPELRLPLSIALRLVQKAQP
jgi:purine catabolism regulator